VNIVPSSYIVLLSRKICRALVKMLAQGRKQKIDSECRGFKEQWNIDYFVTESNYKALCVICNDTIAVLKEYNIRRHYETKHSSQYC